MNIITSTILLISAILISTNAFSANADSLKKSMEISGYADVMFAYAHKYDSIKLFQDGLAGYEPYGFSVPTAGIQFSGKIQDKMTWEVETGIDSLNLFLRDVYFNYQVAPQLEFRAGRFLVPGAFEMWSDSSYFSDGNNWFFDRSHAIYRFNIASYNPDGRSVGAQVHGRLAKGKVYYAMMLTNPDGVASFIPRQNSASYQHYNNSLTGWGRLEVSPIPSVKLGTFIGDGKGRRASDSLLIKLIAYGGNVCYTGNNVFACYEFTRSKTGNKFFPQYVHGHVFMMAYKWKFVQPVFRYSLHIPDAERPDEFGITHYTSVVYGANIHFNDHLFVKVQYCDRTEKTDQDDDFLTNDLFSISVSGKF